MLRRLLRLGLLLGLLGGVAVVLTKLLQNQSRHASPTPTAPAAPATLAAPATPTEPWPRLTSDPAVAASPVARAVPDPDAPSPPTDRADRLWVEPSGTVCPTSHPVKAKLASKIFHLPGMANYERTNPDRCYVDADAAERDGLRAAKR